MWDAVIGRPGQREAKSQAVTAIFQPGENNSNCNSGSGDAEEDIGTLQIGKFLIHKIFTTKELKKSFYPNCRWKFLECHYGQSETLISMS